MIDESVKIAYSKLAPSEECHQRILERARDMDRSREFRRRVALITRVGYAAAAFVLVFALGFLVSSGALQGSYKVYYGGELLGGSPLVAVTESVEYVSGEPMLARHDATEKRSKTASNAVTLEISGKDATAKVTEGTILVYSDEKGCYVEVGDTLEFTGKTKIVWALTDVSTESKLTVTGKKKTYTVKLTSDENEIVLIAE